MKKQNFIIINSIIIIILAFISHFVYDYFKSDITSIFFPVNESIWEHMKLLYTPFLIDALILYFYFEKSNIVYHNLLFSTLFSSLFSIFFYLIIYLPVYVLFNTNLIFDISLLIITILISQMIQYKILKKEASLYPSLSLIAIIIICIILGYLTYNPLRNFIFYDTLKNKYGLNIYVLTN